MEKINIGELLKNCPTGMELDCTICDNVCLDEVTPNMIKCFAKNDVYNTIYFHHDGTYLPNPNAKCVIFPKGKTTWEGFQRPFKDGDIIYVCDEYSDATFTYVAILKQIEKGEKILSHCFYNFEDDYFSTHNFLYDSYNTRFATEEEKQKLFDAIKANGYKWNAETKTLRKLVTFDINTLKPFESKVLVRDVDHYEWEGAIFGRYDGKKFFTIGGLDWGCCIPYEGNEHLLGTTNDCDEYFKTWEE